MLEIYRSRIMKVLLSSADEAKKILKERLMSGWIVVMGDSTSITQLENAIYTPGTAKSSDLEVFGMLPDMVVIVKKTNDLKKLLGNPPDFDRLLTLIFRSMTAAGTLTEYIGYKKNKNEQISKLVSSVTQQW